MAHNPTERAQCEHGQAREAVLDFPLVLFLAQVPMKLKLALVYHVDEDCLEFLILQPPKYGDDRHVPPYPVAVRKGDKDPVPRTSKEAGKGAFTHGQ